MPFWKSLFQNTGPIIGFLANNAGNISKAIEVIAGITGKNVNMEDLMDDEGNALAELHRTLVSAENLLEQKAIATFREPELTADDGIEPFTQGPYHLKAFWPSPAATPGTKDIPPSMTGDFNRFLALNGLPTSIGSGKDAVDVGARIARELFSTDDHHTDGISNIFRKFIDIRIGPVRFKGGQVFYKIPLGNPGSHEAWHAVTRLFHVTNANAVQEMKAEQKALSIRSLVSKDSEAKGSYNSTTITVRFNGARNVRRIMRHAIEKLLQDNPEYDFVSPSIIDGTKFVYQFRTPITVGPARVAGAMSVAIEAKLPAISDQYSLPRMPQVQHKSMTTYVS